MPATLSYFALSKARAFASVSPIRSGENSCITSLPQSASLSPSPDRKSTRLNSSHGYNSYAVFCLKKKKRLGGGAKSSRNKKSAFYTKDGYLPWYHLNLFCLPQNLIG